jgi:hypothetical protein
MPKGRTARHGLWLDPSRLSCAQCRHLKLPVGRKPDLRCQSSGGSDHRDSSVPSDLEPRVGKFASDAPTQCCLWVEPVAFETAIVRAPALRRTIHTRRTALEVCAAEGAAPTLRKVVVLGHQPTARFATSDHPQGMAGARYVCNGWNGDIAPRQITPRCRIS